MSADNVIYVRGEYDGQIRAWFVWEQSASVEPKRPETNEVSSFPSKPEALKYAHEWMGSDRFLYGVEYGVQLLEPLEEVKEIPVVIAPDLLTAVGMLSLPGATYDALKKTVKLKGKAFECSWKINLESGDILRLIFPPPLPRSARSSELPREDSHGGY